MTHVKKLGWTADALEEAARSLSLSPAVVGTLGAPEERLVSYFVRKCNDELRVKLLERDNELRNMRVRDRIKLAVRLRLEMVAPFMDTWPQALAILARPKNVGLAATLLSDISDTIWHGIGDTSTDLQWYTKRALLAGVYTTTELYMLTDYSPDYCDTWDALGRRVEDVLWMGSLVRSLSHKAKEVLQYPFTRQQQQA